MPNHRAILIVDHGSRSESANQLIARVAEQVRERRPDWWVEYAHMEIAKPSFDDGIAACVAGGALEIVVHPYFLGTGRHTSESIPELVAAAVARHPEVTIRVSEPLGPHDILVDLVVARVEVSLG